MNTYITGLWCCVVFMLVSLFILSIDIKIGSAFLIAAVLMSIVTAVGAVEADQNRI